MEEDIKILKEKIKQWQPYKNRRKFSEIEKEIDIENQAIENILNRLEQDERVINKAIEILGEHRHYSSPTEEQLFENENIVIKAYNLLNARKCE